MSSICGYCMVELCVMCDGAEDTATECCCRGTYGRATLDLFGSRRSSKTDSTNAQLDINQDGTFKDPSHPGRPILDGADMKNPTSAGRRRAAKLAPIPPDYRCEWSELRYAGGGPVPIIGCGRNKATDLHHGPDKSTLNNGVGINLHRICSHCHNRWHELNDPYYGTRPPDGSAYLPRDDVEYSPHDRLTRAEPADIQRSNQWWSRPKPGRVGYRDYLRASGLHPAGTDS